MTSTSPEWFPNADRSSHSWQQNSMTKNTGALRVVLHSTENSVGTDPRNVDDYMWNSAGSSTGYHLLVPLESGHRPLQLRPANVAAGSLKNNGTLARSPNKEGTRLIAISLVCYAKDNHGLTGLGPWWGEILAWVQGFGIPNAIIDNRMPPGGGGLNKIPTSVWYSSQSGWCFHATAPNPDSTHWDPGKVDTGVLFSGQGGSVPPPSQEWDPNGNFHRNLLRKDPMMRGEDVKWVQGTVGVWTDGIFGDDTKGAVINWQGAHGLAADGVVGPDTAAAMGMPGAGGTTPPPATGTLGPFPLPEGHWFGQVSSNSKNHSGTGLPSDSPDRNNIRKIQGRVGTTQDGLYGPNTESGVRSFQSGHGLAVDGDCGVKTWSAM
jgi:hypothetical protein